jgi:hypothetical protein
MLTFNDTHLSLCTPSQWNGGYKVGMSDVRSPRGKAVIRLLRTTEEHEAGRLGKKKCWREEGEKGGRRMVAGMRAAQY